MPRDKETQKVRGFAFLMYLDQKSTVLAVDNLNGAKVLGRTIRVDHTKNYRQTKVLNEETGEMEDADEERMNALPKMIGGDGQPAASAPAVIEPGDEEDPMAAYIRDSKVRALALFILAQDPQIDDSPPSSAQRARLLEDPAGSSSGSRSKAAKRAEKEAKRAEKEEKHRRKEAKRADKDNRRHGDGESSTRRHRHDDDNDRRDSRRSTSRRVVSPPARSDPHSADRYRPRSSSPDPRDRRPTSTRERERSPGAHLAQRRRSPSPVRRPKSPPPSRPSDVEPRHLLPSPGAPSRRNPANDWPRERGDIRDDRAYGGRDDRRGGRWNEREPRQLDDRPREERDRRY